MNANNFSELLNFFINLLPFIFIILGFYIGRYREQSHYKNIIEREGRLKHLPVSNFTYQIENTTGVLVCGEVVISNDAFKNFAAYLRNIFGGQIKSFEDLVDRGRRESI